MHDWYRAHLGIEIEPWGGAVFAWKGDDNPSGEGATVWSVFRGELDYFAPSEAKFMINYRVADLDAVLAALRAEARRRRQTTDVSEYGKFGWVMDPEGNRIELWQPPPGR